MKDKQQKKLMKSAGFKIAEENPAYRVWSRGSLRIVLCIGRAVSLKRLVTYVIDQAVYHARKGALIQFQQVTCDNEGGVIGCELS